MSKLQMLLLVAGALHFTILIASALVPRVLDWRANLALLHPFLRRLFWVYGVFIVLVIIGFGTLTLLDSAAMAADEPVARSLAALIAIFWFARLLVQLFVFDCRAFLTTPLLKIGYHCLTLVFVYFTIIYGWVALSPVHKGIL